MEDIKDTKLPEKITQSFSEDDDEIILEDNILPTVEKEPETTEDIESEVRQEFNAVHPMVGFYNFILSQEQRISQLEANYNNLIYYLRGNNPGVQ